MRRMWTCSFPVLVLAIPAPAQNVPDALRADIAKARERVYPALVNIVVVTRYFNEGRAVRAPGAGSGVIVSPQGHVLTNYHVAQRATRIECILPDGETIPARVVLHDPLTDLSVLKLQTEKRADPAKPLPHAVLGDSSKLQTGDYVLAMGNPLMLTSSLTLGVVSNPRRVFVDETRSSLDEMELDEGEMTGLFTRWIQHDAIIAPGNSGGPLVNLRGEVVGINELGYGSGIGFAIPSNIAKDVMRQALEAGVVKRAWLGLTFLPVAKLGRKTGVLVSAVAPQSPAEKAGVKPGDILTKLNGAPVHARLFEEVPLVYERVASLTIGKPSTLEIVQAGETKTLTAVPTQMEQIKGEEEEFPEIGATLERVTRSRALLQHLPVAQGVRVTGVRPGFPLETAQPPLAAEDIIVSIGRKPVATLAEVRKAVRVMPEDGLPVVFRRGFEIMVTQIKPRTEKEPEADTELPRPWLGIRTQVVTADVARALGLAKAGGHRVTEVYEGTEAAKAGLRPGDIIVAMDGKNLRATRVQDSEELKRAVEVLTVGETVKLGILRGGKPATLSISLQPTPRSASSARNARQDAFEFTVREITPMDRIISRWLRGVEGVLVSDVVEGGWAAMAGLQVEDVLLAVGDVRTPSVTAFGEAMAGLMKARPKAIQMYIQRRYRTHFVFLEPDWAAIRSAP